MRHGVWIWAVVIWIATTTVGKEAGKQEIAERIPVWPGLERLVTDELGGFIVPTTEIPDRIGFVDEGDRIRGEHVGHRFSYKIDRGGTFYLGIVLIDDPDGTERLEVSVGGTPIGTAVADQPGGKALFTFAKPLELEPGDEIRFTCKTFVGCYRVNELLFSPKPIVSPAPEFKHVELWVHKPGTVDLCWTTTTVAPTGIVEYAAAGKRVQTEFNDYRGRNHRVTISGLDPSTPYEAKIVTRHRGKEITSEPFTLHAAPPVPPSTRRARIAIRVPEPTDTPRKNWPATVGMPFARGVLADFGDLRLFDSNGEPVVLQTDCTCRWPDGSVKWATLSFLADSSAEGTAYQLATEPGRSKNSPSTEPVASVSRTGNGWNIKTDALSFTVGKNGPSLFTDMAIDGTPAQLGAAAELIAELPDGTKLHGGGPESGDFEVEENGPCRAVLKWRGTLRDDKGNDSGWTYLVRLRLFKTRPSVEIAVSVCNENETPDYRVLRSLAIRLPNRPDATPRVSLDEREAVELDNGKTLALLQDKDHHFSLRCGDTVEEGEHAGGLLTASDGDRCLKVFVRDFWQTYPSGLTASSEAIEAQLLPPLPEDTYSDKESAEWFARLYAWFDDGGYLFRAGQVTRNEVTLCYGKPAKTQNASTTQAWLANPLLPEAPQAYLCGTGVLGRKLPAQTAGQWNKYEGAFANSFDLLAEDQKKNRLFGWMHFGDWCFGGGGYGNNEYDLAWVTGVQWMRTGNRAYFDRGLSMARHYSTADTMHGRFAEDAPCVVWKHCFNHVGSERPLPELCHTEKELADARRNPGHFHVGSDPQGHIFEEGMWLYGALTGDRWFTDTADHVCRWQARTLTPSFDFEIERGGGWPLICAVSAYEFSGDPYYLNAARIMVQRCLERHDPEHGGWPHTPPLSETRGKPVVGGKAFASGILTYGLLRYLDAEPNPRPDVRQMLVNTADWLKDESWRADGGGFVYITNSPRHADEGDRGYVCLMVAETIALAYEETGDEKYRDFLRTILAGTLDGLETGHGKLFSQRTRQTVFALERARGVGVEVEGEDSDRHVPKVARPRASGDGRGN